MSARQARRETDERTVGGGFQGNRRFRFARHRRRMGWAGVPTDPHAKLPRKRIAAALTAAGYPTSPATLGSFATRGGGPPFYRWGMYALYEWGSSLLWAEERLSKPRRTTSEGRELDRAAKAESKS